MVAKKHSSMKFNKKMINELERNQTIIDKALDQHDNLLKRKEVNINIVDDILSDIKTELSNGNHDVGIVELTGRLDIVRERKTVARFQKKINGIKNMLNKEENVSLANTLYMLETDRFKKYIDYHKIVKLLPNMDENVETYLDNIMSPDDYTKQSLNLEYNIPDINKDHKNSVMKKLKTLKTTYDIDKLVKGTIKNALELGDGFIMIKPIGVGLSDAYNSVAKNMVVTTEKLSDKMIELENANVNIDMNRVFNETNTLYKENDILTDDRKLLSEINTLIIEHNKNIDKSNNINNNKFSTLSESKNNPKKHKISQKDIASLMNKVIKDSVVVTDDTSTLLQDMNTIVSERNKRNKNVDTLDLNTKYDSIYGGNYKAARKLANFKNINGSVVRRLEPNNVIKIEVENICYGYYYIESKTGSLNNRIDTASMGLGPNEYSDTGGSGLLSTIDGNSRQNTLLLLRKNKLIHKLFAEKLVHNINDRFIKKNPEFKNIIYNMLEQHDILNHSEYVRITYLPPNEVVHFKVGDNTYGRSIFENVLFLAKIYLATLLSTLMSKLLRGQDHRLFYVDIGLDGAPREEVDAAVRNITQREVKNMGMQDIDTILHVVSQFEDSIIPTYDGEKPLEIDVLPKMDIDINNEFLELLNKLIQAGIGVPTSFIQSLEEVELAKGLSMVHEKFLIRVVNQQSEYQSATNQLIRILYYNEYLLNNKNAENNDIDISQIKLVFPSPTTLRYTNMMDQLNNAKNIVDEIISTMFDESGNMYGDTPNDNNLLTETKTQMRIKLMAKYAPSIDWEELEEMKHNLMISLKKDENQYGDGENNVSTTNTTSTT